MSIYRMLVREEPRGVPAGEISRRLDIVPSTLSGHLAVLRRAGLLKSIRQQREIHYTANILAMNDLVGFMLAALLQWAGRTLQGNPVFADGATASKSASE